MSKTYSQLRKEIEEKVQLDQYGFHWYSEEESHEYSGENDVALAATGRLGHNMPLCLVYNNASNKLIVEMLADLFIEGEASEEFFSYIKRTYIDPIITTGCDQYPSAAYSNKEDDRYRYLHRLLYSDEAKKAVYFLTTGKYYELLVQMENSMIFKELIAHPPMELASAAFNPEYAHNVSRFLTSFSASSIAIVPLYKKGRVKAPFFLRITYFPDDRIIPAIKALKQDVLKDTPLAIIPDDVPLDLAGALIQINPQQLMPIDEWEKAEQQKEQAKKHKKKEKQ